MHTHISHREETLSVCLGASLRLSATTMAKRSRSVLHAYILPHPERMRDGRRQPQSLCSPTVEAKADKVNQPRVNGETGSDDDRHDCERGATGAAFVSSDKSSILLSRRAAAGNVEIPPLPAGGFLPTCALNNAPHVFPDEWERDVDNNNNSVSLDEPFIPEADQLVGLPPSCRAVQKEPNWLERALMRVHCSAASPANKCQLPGGSVQGFSRPTPPAPNCVHLVSMTQEERRRAATIAEIAVTFYAATSR